MTVFHGIDDATAEFLLGPWVNEFEAVAYMGRMTQGHAGLLKVVETYEVIRHGETESVSIPEGDGYHVSMSEGIKPGSTDRHGGRWKIGCWWSGWRRGPGSGGDRWLRRTC